MPVARRVVLAALLAQACASCPDAGFTAPGSYGAVLDSRSTTSGPTCMGTDMLAVGMTLNIHVATNAALSPHCTTWIDRAGTMTSPSYPPPAGVLGSALGDGVFVTTLPSGCSGKWEINLADLDRAMPFGTTPDPSTRPYYLTRVFIPDDVPACHTQFGAFAAGSGAICADSWAAHLIPVAP